MAGRLAPVVFNHMAITTILLGVGVFAVLMLGMSVGVFFGRPRLRGSCGGGGVEGDCSVCGAQSEAHCTKEPAVHARH